MKRIFKPLSVLDQVKICFFLNYKHFLQQVAFMVSPDPDSTERLFKIFEKEESKEENQDADHFELCLLTLKEAKLLKPFLSTKFKDFDFFDDKERNDHSIKNFLREVSLTEGAF